MTAPTVTNYPNEGVVRRAQGSFSGTYTAATDVYNAKGVVMAAGVITITLGFVPKKFTILNCTDRIKQEWFDGMNSGDFIETAANGTVSLETDDQVVVALRTGAAGSSGGGGTADTSPSGTVTITASGGAMTDNDTVVWVAEG